MMNPTGFVVKKSAETNHKSTMNHRIQIVVNDRPDLLLLNYVFVFDLFCSVQSPVIVGIQAASPMVIPLKNRWFISA